jgi:hypothetical protein
VSRFAHLLAAPLLALALSLPASAAAPPLPTISGSIAETMDAGGYTYIQIDTGTEKIWVAGPQTAGLEPGAKITVPRGMEMRDFRSASLERTFPSILFVSAIWPEGKEPATALNSGGMVHGSPHGGSAPGVVQGSTDPHAGLPLFGEVAGNQADVTHFDAPLPKAPGGLSVAEVLGQGKALSGKDLTIRGRVVRYTSGVLGTNWLHIQDGSGDADEGTHDLAVTTDATAAVGDQVLVRGRLSFDRDFGAGYLYPILIEGASLEIEAAKSSE